MKLKGTFTVELSNSCDTHMPQGAWRVVTEKGDSISSYVFDEEEDYVAPDLSSIEEGDSLYGESATGKTGIVGRVIYKDGPYITVEGSAWGPSSAYASEGAIGWDTHTFSVTTEKAVYDGSLEELVGTVADHQLLSAIERAITRRREGMARVAEAARLYTPPAGAVDARIWRGNGRARVSWVIG